MDSCGRIFGETNIKFEISNFLSFFTENLNVITSIWDEIVHTVVQNCDISDLCVFQLATPAKYHYRAILIG